MSNNTEMENYFFRASAEDFKKIPGSPISYSATKSILDLFGREKLSDSYDTRLGMATADNDQFLRLWHEVSNDERALNIKNREDAIQTQKTWFTYQKGGDYRKWYGNYEYLVNWFNDGEKIRNFANPETGKIRSHNYNLDFVFKRGVTWNALTSNKTSARLSESALFDNAGSSLFVKENSNAKLETVLGLINSNTLLLIFPLISPTLNYQPGDLSKLPAYFPDNIDLPIINVVNDLINRAKTDWDSYETSWDFTTLPLLSADYRKPTLSETYATVRQHWLNTTLEMQRLEEENNRIFIDAYGLQDELTPDVPLKEITLTCNPYYRYGKEAEQQGKEYPLDTKLEERLRADTMAEFISYAVGCMFGRYSLDKEGLVLANQGESLADYLAQVPNPSFEIDDDNVIPILDADWFADDIVERFRKFLRVTFGDAHFSDNLAFIEKALGKDVRSYFLKDFYADHVQRYKKRPIYWMFSSPKGSFNALIYMHRYRQDNVSVVLNDYLREFRTKLEAQIKYQEAVEASSSASPSDKTKALKEIDRLKKVLIELDDYERDTLYPLATQQLTIDLDDGVKVNYPKFGNALKKIVGL